MTEIRKYKILGIHPNYNFSHNNNFEPSKDAPFPFIVKSNEAKLIFKSDKEEQKSGFALT